MALGHASLGATSRLVRSSPVPFEKAPIRRARRTRQYQSLTDDREHKTKQRQSLKPWDHSQEPETQPTGGNDEAEEEDLKSTLSTTGLHRTSNRREADSDANAYGVPTELAVTNKAPGCVVIDGSALRHFVKNAATRPPSCVAMIDAMNHGNSRWPGSE